jgi:hypothetical protein
MNTFNSICSNPWCKAPYSYTENDFYMIEGVLTEPKTCKKCFSFSNELSGGVEWIDKSYDGNRFDNEPHQIRYKVTNYKL